MLAAMSTTTVTTRSADSTPPSNPTLSPRQWTEIGFHSTLGAMFATATLLVCAAVAAVVHNGITTSPVEALAYILFFIIILSASVLFVAAMMLLLSSATMVVAQTVDRGLQPGLPPELQGAFWGAWICGGNLVVFFLAWLPEISFVMKAAALAVTTTIGAYSGAIGGWRSTMLDLAAGDNAGIQGASQFRFRFRIHKLMIVSAATCVLAWLVKVSGLYQTPLLIWLGVWLGELIVVVAVGVLIWPSYIDWRTTRWVQRTAT